MKTTDEMTGKGSLVAQAQEAYEQKRTKECVNLIRQVIATDPDNVEARTLQSSIQSDIERDLVDARTLLRDSQKDGGLKYRKAAEIILLKIIYLDPDHHEAKSLLAEARGTQQVQTPASPSLPAEHAVRSAHSEDLIFTAAPVPFENHEATKRGGLSGKLPVLIVAALIVVVGVVLTYGFWAKKPSVASTDAAAPSLPATVSEKPKPSTAGVTAPPVKPLAAPALTPTTDAAAVAVPAVPDTPPPVVTGKGWLAVSSATSAEIYLGGKHLGETPTTLQLNSGRQTLEYRHDNLKTTMTHEIKPKETTTAFVTFDVDVQINARPWAQVFVEGSTRRALGQTPLGSVRVPIGSTLTFENPSFPSKTHKVTDKDSAIQVVFP
jgi:hypothetical protein